MGGSDGPWHGRLPTTTWHTLTEHAIHRVLLVPQRYVIDHAAREHDDTLIRGHQHVRQRRVAGVVSGVGPGTALDHESREVVLAEACGYVESGDARAEVDVRVAALFDDLPHEPPVVRKGNDLGRLKATDELGWSQVATGRRRGRQSNSTL